MTSDTDALSDAVMNALWFPEFYCPTRKADYVQPTKELHAGKLAREYVPSTLFLFRLSLIVFYRSFWSRCIRDAGPGCQARFKETLELFFEAVNIQAKDRDAGVIPDLESYINVRRDTSGQYTFNSFYLR